MKKFRNIKKSNLASIEGKEAKPDFFELGEIEGLEPESVVGPTPVLDADSDEGVVIFIDGDVLNHDETNIIDCGYFRECYSYDDFLEDYQLRDRLLVTNDELVRQLKQAKQLIKDLKNAAVFSRCKRCPHAK
jgi:hypothetical protein